MTKAKKILPVLSAVIVTAVSLTGVCSTAYAAEVEDNDLNTRPVISMQQEGRLSEKLEAGEITQEQYDEIIAAIESRDFRGVWGKGAMRGNASELTEEQKAELPTKRDEMLAEKLESGEITQEQYDEIIAAIESGDFSGIWNKGAMWNHATELTEEQKAELSAKIAEKLSDKLEAGEITQEQYDEIIVAIEAGDFAGHELNFGKLGELTEEQKTEFAEKWSENAQSGKFGGMFGNRINGSEELTDEQKAEIAEKQVEIAENGGFGAFRGGMRGNFGACGK